MSGGGPLCEPTQTGAAWPSHLEEMQRATWAYARITRAAPPAVLLCLVAWLTLGAGLFLGSPLAGRIAMLLAAPVWVALVAASRKLRPPAVVAEEDREEARSRKRYVQSLQVIEAGILLLLFWGWRGEPAAAGASILGLSACVLALPLAWMAAGRVLRSTVDARQGLLLALLGATFVVPRDEVQVWPLLLAAAMGLWLAADAVMRGLERRCVSRRLAAARDASGLAQPEPPPQARAEGPWELRRAVKEYEEQAKRRGLEGAIIGGWVLLAAMPFPGHAAVPRIVFLAAPLAWIAAAWINSRFYPRVEPLPAGRWWVALFGLVGLGLIRSLATATWYRASLSRNAAVTIATIVVVLVLIAAHRFARDAGTWAWVSLVPASDVVRDGGGYRVWSVLGALTLVVGISAHLRFRAAQRRLRSLEGRPEGRGGGQP